MHRYGFFVYFHANRTRSQFEEELERIAVRFRGRETGSGINLAKKSPRFARDVSYSFPARSQATRAATAMKHLAKSQKVALRIDGQLKEARW